MFASDLNGNLRYETTLEDGKRPDIETGYVAATSGDSGSPYWTEYDNGGNEIEPRIVAVHNKAIWPGRKNQASYQNDPKYECTIMASKITDDIVRWAREKERVPVDKGKVTPPWQIRIEMKRKTERHRQRQCKVNAKGGFARTSNPY